VQLPKASPRPFILIQVGLLGPNIAGRQAAEVPLPFILEPLEEPPATQPEPKQRRAWPACPPCRRGVLQARGPAAGSSPTDKLLVSVVRFDPHNSHDSRNGSVAGPTPFASRWRTTDALNAGGLLDEGDVHVPRWEVLGD
jgi:hypothetical protein